MADLQALLAFRDALRAARYGGTRRFRDQNGEEIEYWSDAELSAAMAALEAEIAALQAKPSSRIHPKFSKGL